MQPPFTLSDLEYMATPRSFERGQDYYEEGAVRQLTYDGEQFTARVHGSYHYRVTIGGSPDAPQLHCTCPYDYGGICKHLVAVGLAILEGEAETEATLYEEATAIEESTRSSVPFSELFEQTTDPVKLRFLRQLLDGSAALRAQFAKYAEPYSATLTTPSNSTSPTEILESTKEEIVLHLESLSFDEENLFDPDYHARGGYYDEWDDAHQGAQRIIREALGPYERRIRHHWQRGELLRGTAVLLGLYEGRSLATEPAHDPLDILYDSYADTVSEVLAEVMAELFTTFDSVVKSPAEAQASLDLLLERYRQYDVSVRELRHSQTYVLYQLGDFQPWLIALTNDPDTARYLINQLQEHDLVDVDTAPVVLSIAEQLDNEALWWDTAEEFAPYDVAVTRRLLNRHRTEGHAEEFLRVARQAFAQFPDQVDEYLADHLSADEAPDLRRRVYLHLIRRLHRLDHYQLIRPDLSPSEKDTLIRDIGQTADDSFYVQLLAQEERYADILQRVRARADVDYSLSQLIEPILSVYPDQCFKLLRRRCQTAVQQRGRSVYRLIARWLQLMQQIPGYGPAARDLAHELYHHQPRLPALRDEMQQAGVAP